MYAELIITPKEAEQKEALSRILNLLSKLMKTVDGSQAIVNSKEIISRVLLYFILDDPEYSKNALITLHTCCKLPQFREVCFEKHKFTMKSFDPYVV